jgi:hypothetical protein
MQWKFLLALGLGLSVVSTPMVVRADNTEVGAEILTCFHPMSRFSSAELGATYQDNGYTALNGVVNFLGVWTDNRYHMRFKLLTRVVDGAQEFRVIPGEDTAPFPPDEDCRFRSWSPINMLSW